MMVEVSCLREKERLKALPQKVQETIIGILQILDAEYGANRNKYEDARGYVVVVEKIEDFKDIIDKAYIDCNEVIVEYIDKIVCSKGEVYTNSLIIFNNDYAIYLIISLKLTPQNLKDYIIH